MRLVLCGLLLLFAASCLPVRPATRRITSPHVDATQPAPSPLDSDPRLVRDHVDEFRGEFSVYTKPIEFGGIGDRTLVTIRCAPAEGRAGCILELHSMTKEWLYMDFHPRAFEFLVDGERLQLETFGQPDRDVIRGTGVSEAYVAKLPYARLIQFASAKEVRFRLFPRSFEIPPSGRAILQALVERLRQTTSYR